MRVRAALGALALPILFPCAAFASTPPPGFVEHVLVDGGDVSAPTGIAYEPGSGNLYVLEKGADVSSGTALVRVWNKTSGAVTTALPLSCVDGQGERGLLGIAFDPAYLSGSRFVYLYYTHAFSGGSCGSGGGSKNRVARFVESGGTLSGETVLLDGPTLGATNHNGGTLRFGNDGTLFVSVGDNDTDADASPASRNLNDLRGKILRIHKDGSIPTSNPYFNQPGKRGEIFSWGLRNPFRISVDSANGDLYIADVGENTYEEIDLGVSGGDYGYPCFEGPAPFRSCVPAAPIAPIFYYGHSGETPPVNGATVIGGPVYRGATFRTGYDGQYFFGDYIDSWIRRADVDPTTHALKNVQVFLPDADNVVDMAVSPAGCLTWVGISGAGVRDVCDVLKGSDFDGSQRVDGLDLARMARAFGSKTGDPNFDPAVDIDLDGFVDGVDLANLASVFGLALP